MESVGLTGEAMVEVGTETWGGGAQRGGLNNGG